jgi:outer membrane protein
MMRKIICALVLVMGFAASASAVELGVRGSYWFPDFEADVKVGGGGTTIDVVDTLGLDDENFPAMEVYAGLGSHHFAFAVMQMGFEGDKDVTQEIIFNGVSYGSVTERIVTDLDITMLDFYYQYDLLDLENIAAGFSLGPLLQVKYLDAEVTLDGEFAEEVESVQLPLPMLGLGMHVGILADLLEVRARIAGIGYSGNSVIEAIAEINYSPFPFVDVGVGYRYLALDIDESDVMIDMTLAGPFAALTVGF